jgi:hypothetical protein
MKALRGVVGVDFYSLPVMNITTDVDEDEDNDG